MVNLTRYHLLYVLVRDALLAAQDLPELALLQLASVVRVKEPEDLRQGVLVRLRPPLDGDEPEVFIEADGEARHVHGDSAGHRLGLERKLNVITERSNKQSRETGKLP